MPMDLDDVVPMRLRDADPAINRVTGQIVDSAVAVQKGLGAGLLERAYELALAHELRLRGLHVETQVALDAVYRDLRIPRAYVVDMVVEGCVVVELKTTEAVSAEHVAQLATYLQFAQKRIGLLINFRQRPIRQGIRRIAGPS